MTLVSAWGQNWSATSAPSLEWNSITTSADGAKLAAVAYHGGIYVSTNSGLNWKLTSAPNLPWTSIASSTDGTNLIATASSGKIYLSANSGSTWTDSSAPSNTWFSVASSADGSELAAAAADGGLSVSTNSGLSWFQPPSLVQPLSAVTCAADGATLIAASDPGAIYTSTNSGIDWESNSAPTLSWSALAASSDGGRLYAAATLGGIFVSTNLGQTWDKTSATNDSWFAIACSADGTNLLAAALHRGLYVSTNAGATWTKTQAMPAGWSSVAMSASGADMYATAYNGGIYVPGSTVLSFLNSTYQGLFYSTNKVGVPNSGFMTVSTKTNGTVSTRLFLAGKSFSFSGKFSQTGFSSNSIPRTGLSPLIVLMQISSESNDLITGQVSDGTWIAQLTAYANIFSKTNPCPQAGKYTLVFPGSDTPAIEPGGDGYATLTVDALGTVSMTGKLAEGSALAQKTSVSQNGQWPLFATLYSGKGSLLGWQTFSNTTSNDVAGLVSWIAPSNAAVKIYRAGFTNTLEAVGSTFQFSKGVRVLNISTGQVSVVNGNLSRGITNRFVLNTNSQVINLDTNKLTVTITSASGLFSGSIGVPGTGKTVAFTGVVLQKQNIGSGFFLGTNQSGRVLLSP